jgi:hypothetical protein
MLRDDESRDVFEYRRWAQQWFTLHLRLADVACRGGRHVADSGGYDGNAIERLRRQIGGFGRMRPASRKKHDRRGAIQQDLI